MRPAPLHRSLWLGLCLIALSMAACKAEDLEQARFATCPSAPPHQGSRLGAGNGHTCFVSPDHKLWCWGDGAMGLGDIRSAPKPTRVPQLDDVRAFAGGNTSCAVLGDGSVHCWGDADAQILADDVDETTVPVKVPGITDAVKVTVGYAHACALRAGGQVVCWGQNGNGQLGTNGNQDVKGLSEVDLPGPVRAIAAGGEFTCAVDGARDVWCWGAGDQNQLGQGSNVDWAIPASLGDISCASEIMAGDNHACAVANGGEVLCWGGNGYGQSGGKTATQTINGNVVVPYPTRIDSVDGAIAGDGHEMFTCAATAAGKALCWGDNERGELGDGSGVGKAVPTPIAIADVVAVANGHNHACAADANDDVWCWGDNRAGELGQNMMPDAAGFDTVEGTKTATAVSTSAHTTCALIGGKPWCWGMNRQGQASYADARNLVTEPVQVSVDGILERVVTGGMVSCGITDKNAAVCWGATTWDTSREEWVRSKEATPVPGLAAVTEIAIGSITWEVFACALDTAKHAWCWGQNDAKQLGSATTERSATALPVDTTQTFSALALGEKHACGLAVDGQVWCWGANDDGQLGHTTGPKPAPVPGLLAKAIDAGPRQTCALDTEDRIWCWGANNAGQLGIGKLGGDGQPKVVAEAATSIRVGGDVGCGLIAGALKCWGSNEWMQVLAAHSLGADDTIVAPQTVALKGVTSVSVGENHVCALVADSGVVCWGDNRWGQHGVGTRGGWSLSPLKVVRPW